MLVPYQEISSDALFSLAKEWVVSNLTEVESEPDILKWTEQTLLKIKQGELVVEYGEESETVYLKPKESINFEQ